MPCVFHFGIIKFFNPAGTRFRNQIGADSSCVLVKIIILDIRIINLKCKNRKENNDCSNEKKECK